jgi:DNA-binding transcriptional regulator YiaG
VIQRKVELLHKIKDLQLTSDDAFQIRQQLLSTKVQLSPEEIEQQEIKRARKKSKEKVKN